MPAALDILLTRLSRREQLARASRGALVGALVACPMAIAAGVASVIPIASALGAVVGALRPVRKTELASRVDRIADLRELLATASSIAPTTEDPFERVVLAQANERAREVDLRAAGASFPSARAVGATLLACAASMAVMLPLHRAASSSNETASRPRPSTPQNPSTLDRSPGSLASSRSDTGRNDATSTSDPRGDAPTRIPDASRQASTSEDSSIPSPASSDGTGTGTATSDDRTSTDRTSTNPQARDESQNAVDATGTGSTSSQRAGTTAAEAASSATPRADDSLSVDRIDFLPPASKDAARAALRDGRVPAHARAVVRAYFDLRDDR